jgi:hypothetical protein
MGKLDRSLFFVIFLFYSLYYIFMRVFIIEIISRISYCILCYLSINACVYFTYGWQCEYEYALVSKAYEQFDFCFSESIVWDNISNTNSSLIAFDQDLASSCTRAKEEVSNKVTSKAIQFIIHSGLDWSRLWLTNVAFFYSTDFKLGLTAAINGFLLLTLAFMHYESFLSPSKLAGVFNGNLIYGMFFFGVFLSVIDGWLFLASIITELAIEPIDYETKL